MFNAKKERKENLKRLIMTFFASWREPVLILNQQ